MKNWLFDKLGSYVDRRRAKQATYKRVRDRRYDKSMQQAIRGGGGFHGGQIDQLTHDWNPRSLSPAQLHRMDGRVLRSRARDLYDNNPWAQSGVNAWVTNVVECGITPKPRFSEEMGGQEASKAWQDGWNWWGGIDGELNECDVTYANNIYELMALWFLEILVGGGCITNYRTLPRSQSNGHSIPLACELIPEERFAEDKDTFVISHNSKKSSNQIVNGVEIESSTGRAVAYWVRQFDPNDTSRQMEEPLRLSRDHAKYSYLKKRSGQYRGYTMLAASVIWLWKLGYFTDNELMASVVKSCYAVMIKSDDEVATGLGDGTSVVTDMDGNSVEKISPVSFMRVPSDAEVTGVGPHMPKSDEEAFIMFIQRAIAMGIDLSYEEMSRDATKGNFAQIRSSKAGDQKRFRVGQKFTIRNFCNPTWHRFVKMASTFGVEGFPTPSDLMLNLRGFMLTTWRTPGWVSVNPLEDAKANQIKLDTKTTTREIIVSADGGDIEEIDEQIVREETASPGLRYGLGQANDPSEMEDSEEGTKDAA